MKKSYINPYKRKLEPYSKIEWRCESDYNIQQNYYLRLNGSNNIIIRGYCRADGNSLPLFKYVSSHFTCNDNQLTSLEGCPIYVGGGFHCEDNQLTNLDYSPLYTGRGFYCYNNKIKLSHPVHITILGNFQNE